MLYHIPLYHVTLMLSEYEDSDFSEEFEDDGDDYDTVSIASEMANLEFRLATDTYRRCRCTVYKRRAEQLEGDLEERDNEIDRLKAENERLQYSDGSLNASKAERCERKSKDHLRTARNEYTKVVQERKEMVTCVAKIYDVCKHMQQCSAEDSVALRNIRSALVSVPNMGPVVEVLRDTDKRMSLSDRVRNMNGRLGDGLKKLSKLLHTANSQAERNLHKAERRLNGAQQVKRKSKTPKRK
ncbi:hypothetical protein SLS60_001778 [Paraconiothyrium brasiliense]|uniref:Uncharacterized protein n=1 Tax=Paraconiothyrium brasiliense TaxID=300254 RepID=A0ABR3S0U2_9PLEO